MSTRMLIDATHSEETRVAITKGTRVEDFDFESATKKQLKGNIYLAKVTRIEPSLQAAFVDYGGNRHGFLAFSEIHSDYYQIPVEDREALLAEEREAARHDDHHHDDHHDDHGDGNGESGNGDNGGRGEVEAIVSHHDDVADELPRRHKRMPRRYKIQEVIRRRQILLVQVVKEERGNKGAALTTYLSLPGRYCVLMPNTHHGGGISRKIANPKDRRKLKEILQDLDLPDGMGCIIRTAGLSRSKAEIRRDFDYLQRTWDEIRELTLRSIAPALIYEEGDLIKRAIRDLYNKDIDDILVEGDEGYRSAKNFMKLLMPSHAKKVKHYKDRIPLFHRYQVEGQMDAMYNPVVQLKSGGYIVINPTEALVAIDVNSGKSTREHNIEETALRTNLEAAEEAARQIRLRDMAGLVVIDFIDMEDRNNNRAVERKLKDCLKSDRARIQMGKISAFGLLEMSRQRLRPGLLEASTMPCPHCDGTGIIRSVESAALHVLRAIEEEGIRGRSAVVHLHVPGPVALYLLNQKRGKITEIETHYGFRLLVEVDNSLVAPKFRMERENLPRDIEREQSADLGEPVILVEDDDLPDEAEEAEEAEELAEAEARTNGDARVHGNGAHGNGERGEGHERRKRRRRRRRRSGDRHPGENGNGAAMEMGGDAEDADHDHEVGHDHEAGHDHEYDAAPEGHEGDRIDSGADGRAEAAGDHDDHGDHDERKRRRRGRRGGRRRGRGDHEHVSGEEAAPAAEMAAETDATESAPAAAEAVAAEPAEAPAQAAEAPAEAAAVSEAAPIEITPEVVAEAAPEPVKKPARRGRKAATAEADTAAAEPAAEPAVAEAEATPAKAKPQRRAKAAAAPASEEPVAVETPAAAPVATDAANGEALAADAEAAAQKEGEPRHASSAPVKVTEVGSTPASGEKRRRGWWQKALGN